MTTKELKEGFSSLIKDDSKSRRDQLKNGYIYIQENAINRLSELDDEAAEFVFDVLEIYHRNEDDSQQPHKEKN
jgi:hypothetical protein